MLGVDVELWKEKVEKNKLLFIYLLIAISTSLIFRGLDIAILVGYLLILYNVYKGLKKDFLKIWSWVIILIFAQFFVLDNLIPYLFKIQNFTLEVMKLWKEFVILESIYLLIKNKNLLDKIKTSFINDKCLKCFSIAVIAWILCMIITIPKANSIFIAIYGMRVYLIGYIVFFIFILGDYSAKEILKFINRIAVGFVYLSIWGIFQAFILGDKFLLELGYGMNGALSSSYYISGYFGKQRVVSTFASPNTFGLIASIICMYFVYNLFERLKDKKTNYKNIVCFAITFIALIFSFSRSAYIAFGVAFIIFVFMELEKKYKIMLSSTVGIIGIITVILSFLLVDKVKNMFINHIFRTITLRDTSVIGHIESTDYAMKVMKNNPFGVGVGMSGQKALQFMDNALHAENSYFIVGFDLGIVGLIVYLIILSILGYSLFKMYKNPNDILIKNINKLAFVSFVGIHISYLFLPTIQELEVTYIFFPIVALVWRSSINNLEVQGE